MALVYSKVIVVLIVLIIIILLTIIVVIVDVIAIADVVVVVVAAGVFFFSFSFIFFFIMVIIIIFVFIFSFLLLFFFIFCTLSSSSSSSSSSDSSSCYYYYTSLGCSFCSPALPLVSLLVLSVPSSVVVVIFVVVFVVAFLFLRFSLWAVAFVVLLLVLCGVLRWFGFALGFSSQSTKSKTGLWAILGRYPVCTTRNLLETPRRAEIVQERSFHFWGPLKKWPPVQEKPGFSRFCSSLSIIWLEFGADFSRRQVGGQNQVRIQTLNLPRSAGRSVFDLQHDQVWSKCYPYYKNVLGV